MSQCVPTPSDQATTMYSPSTKKPSQDKLEQVRSQTEQDTVLFRLATLKSSKENENDGYEDVVGDWRLARFLQSVEGDVAEAVKSFQHHLKWRLNVNAESIRNQVRGKPFRISSFPHASLLVSSGLQKPCVDAGRSRLGDLVHLESIGHGDARELIKNLTEQQLLEHYVAFFELRSLLLESESENNGRLIRSVQIRDMSRFGLHLISERSALGALQALVKVGAENYPESTSYAIFTRTPSFFASAWSLLARILPARTAKKVRFVSFADTPATLMKYVQPISIVALQRLSWNEDGDEIADDVSNLKSSSSFSRELTVPARGTEHVYVALSSGQKCTFQVIDEDGKDVTGFAEVLHVSNGHHAGVPPEQVEVHKETMSTKGSASCARTMKNCLVVISIDSNSWFSLKTFKVDVKVLDP